MATTYDHQGKTLYVAASGENGVNGILSMTRGEMSASDSSAASQQNKELSSPSSDDDLRRLVFTGCADKIESFCTSLLKLEPALPLFIKHIKAAISHKLSAPQI